MTPEALIDLARVKGILIATAESCTGGLIAGALTDVAGSSAVFERGFVTYSNAAKTELLGVDPGLIATFGAVSEAVAQAMAEGALAASDAALTISVTGIAGPGGSDGKPEGRVCFGRVQTGGNPHVETVEFGAIGRKEVRRATVAHALTLLGRALN